MSERFIVKEILTFGENILKEAGDADYKKDAQMFLCEVLKYDEQKLFMNWMRELDDKYTDAYFDATRRRADGEPAQYIIGRQSFMGRDFITDKRALIPRDDTETLVREALAYMDKNPDVKNVLDLCTGSGAIAVSLAAERRHLKLTASDISGDALDLARQNAKKFSAEKQIDFICSDIFTAFKTGFRSRKYDLIISNPPYIRRSELSSLQKEIYEHEPLDALDGGEDGLDFYRAIIEGAPAFMNKKKAALMLEIGCDQAADVSALIEAGGVFGAPEVIKDIAGHDRVVVARLFSA